MMKNSFASTTVRVLLIFLASLPLALGAMLLSVNYQYPENPACAGMLGAGFPLMFICDDWGGGSPTSSWGIITPVDVVNGGVIWEKFWVDFLFYTALIFITILILRAVHQRMTAAQNRLRPTST